MWFPSCAVGLIVLVAACGSSAGGTGNSSSPSSRFDCGVLGKPGPVVEFRAETGRELRGVMFGRAAVAVVLAHQSDQTLCNELNLAHVIAAHGFEAFAFDVGGDAPAPANDPTANYQSWDRDVAAAVVLVRSKGATRTLLLGASQGGCAVLVAATELTPSPEGVVSLSGERHVADLDCDAAASKYSGALLIVASTDDHYLNSAAAHSLIVESPSQDKRAIVLPGTVHGSALLGEDGVMGEVLSFLQSHSK
jgi:esterase/lipase